MTLRPLLLPITLFLIAATSRGSNAQSPTIDWTNPLGGSFLQPSNWSPRVVPGPNDTARFDLDADFSLLGPLEYGLAGLRIGESDVRWRQDTGRGRGFLFTFDLEIGTGLFDKPRRLDRPGRLRLDGGLLVQAGRLAIGKSNLASQIVIGPDVRVEASDLDLTSQASLKAILGGDPFQSLDPRLFISGDAGLDRGFGSLEIAAQGLGQGAPPIASEHVVVAALSYLDPSSFPFIVTRPPSARTFDLSIQTGSFGPAIHATVKPVETLVTVTPAESSSLSEPPTKILAVDLDQNGLDDLVVLTSDGKISIYAAQASGGFAPPVDYGVGTNPVDVAAGTFDDDGTIDLAFGCEGPGTLEYLLNPFNDVTRLQTGPSTSVEGEIRSIAPMTYLGAEAMVAGPGVVVTSDEPGRGRATGYVIVSASVEKVAEIEIGDDPGPSDPIEDEQKKDPDPPVGIGDEEPAAATARGADPTPVLRVLESTTQGFETREVIPLSGRAIDFVSGRFDADEFVDCLVITETGNLDLVRPGQPNLGTNSIPLPGRATSIALGDLDGDGGPEIVIGLDSPPRIEIYALQSDTLFPGQFSSRVILEQVSSLPLAEVAISLAATDLPVDGSLQSNIVLGFGGTGPTVTLGEVDVVETPTCVRVDFNGDGVVDGADLAPIIAAWGPCDGCPEDLNKDGEVDALDLGLVFTEWGECTG